MGACKFGRSNCWFIHNNIENSTECEINEHSTSESNKVIQKLFKMVKTMKKVLYYWKKLIKTRSKTPILKTNSNNEGC